MDSFETPYEILHDRFFHLEVILTNCTLTTPSNGTPCLLFCESSLLFYIVESASIILDGAKLCIPGVRSYQRTTTDWYFCSLIFSQEPVVAAYTIPTVSRGTSYMKGFVPWNKEQSNGSTVRRGLDSFLAQAAKMYSCILSRSLVKGTRP
jgi:hypothetical protein